ncbi:MAG: hypothetical protein AABY55_03875 [Candidatus Omnitrophota bacterium]
MALGSLPRGELSYKMDNENLVMFSDIDLLVIRKDRIRIEEETAIKKALKDIREDFQPGNPLFDITIEFLTLRDFKQLPFKVRFYELKESGDTLFGEDLRHLIPKFDISNLNIKDTNNIIIRRLFSMSLYFPKALFREKKTGISQEAFKYTLARNALDIATVLLFSKGIFLPTYKKRAEYIISKPGDFINALGPDFPEFLTRCLKIKLDLDFNQSLVGLFEDTLKHFKSLLIYTLKNNKIDLKVENSLLPLIRKSKKDIFGEAGITTAKFEFILKSSNLNMLKVRLNALSYSFLGCSIFFLLKMNKSACLFLKADRRCLSVLDDAWWVLIRLGILNPEESIPIDFINRFLALREKFLLNFYIKYIIPQAAAHIEEILNSKYE